MRYRPSDLTYFDIVMPPQALPLVLILFVMTPMVLLTGESLLLPLLEWVKTSMKMGNESSFDFLPFHFYIKLGAFLILAFFGAFQLILRINSIYYATWMRALNRPHPLHVDYHPDANHSVFSLMRWKLYQALMIVLPPVGMALLTAFVGMVEMYLFNTFGEFSFISLSIQLTISVFIFLMLMMFSGFSVLNSLWNSLTTIFGSVIAIAEPELPAKLVFERCNRIAFHTKTAYFLYPAYFLFGIVVCVEAILLLLFVDIHEFITFNANIPLIMTCTALTIAGYIMLNYMRLSSYHDAMIRYYDKLPAQMRDCFSPPPPSPNTWDMIPEAI